MTFAVVIPTAHRPGPLKRMLESILAGTRLPDEIVVVDQSRDDATQAVLREVAQRFPRLQSHRDSGSGTCRSKNIGWRMTSSDVVCFTDDDATVDPCWFEYHTETAKAYPDFGVIGGPVWIPNLTESLPLRFPESGLGLMPWLDLPPDTVEFPRAGVPVGVNFVVRRDVLERISGFNEDLGVNSAKRYPIYGEEGDLCRRVQSLGLRILYSAKAVVWHPLLPSRNSLSYYRTRIGMEILSFACFRRAEHGVVRILSEIPKAAALFLRAVFFPFGRSFHEMYVLGAELRALFLSLVLTPRSLIRPRKAKG